MTPLATTNLYAERMPPRALFFGFNGRISRRTFWLYGVVVLLGLALLGHALLDIAGVRAEVADLVVNLILVWPALAISAKRWHDRDRSAVWLLINLLPVIGWLWALIDNGAVKGTAGPNRFGADPLENEFNTAR
jgi:uncharacterized membrane protein YhaH (DUF805 family)